MYTDITRLPNYNSLPTSDAFLSTIASVNERVTVAVQHPLLHTRVALEGRSTTIRSEETNLGNMLADALRAFYDTDIAFINSGGVRCDRVIEPTEKPGKNSGALMVKDLVGKFRLILHLGISRGHVTISNMLPFHISQNFQCFKLV